MQTAGRGGPGEPTEDTGTAACPSQSSQRSPGQSGAGTATAALGYLGIGSSRPRSSVETAFKQGLLLGCCFAMSTRRLLGHHLHAPCTKPSAGGHQGCRSGSVLPSQQAQDDSHQLSPQNLRHTPPGHNQHHHPSYGTLLPEACCHALVRHLSQSREGAGGTSSLPGLKQSSNQQTVHRMRRFPARAPTDVLISINY